jgi:UDP-N-acetylmuramoyl-L-alanyl-D-glutamate--2,6-diaminopimelate ligase
MRSKSLSELITPDLLVKSQTVEALPIIKIAYDSRKIKRGSLFIAIKGYTADGHHFIEQAQKNGAVAAIVEEENKQIQLPQFVVKDSRQALARIAHDFYSPELDKIRLVGVTGTNGKTTTSFLIQSILNVAGLKSGLIGTIRYDTGAQYTKAWNTTPESVDLFEMIIDMQENGQSSCVLEASSHGLALHRLDSLQFAAAVFTNLSQDHLDFHHDFEDYYQSKKILFSLLKPDGRAIINRDDPFGQRLFSEIQGDKIDFSVAHDSHISAKNWQSSLAGIEMDIQTPKEMINIKSPLIGKFNVENILAAAATGYAMNIDPEKIKIGIENLASVPGRLEPVQVDIDRTILVDYSHTPDALEKALKELKKISQGNLWVVFGCGGDRDKKKRPLMGKIAQNLADRIIITSDNPRSESPESIINDILNGLVQDSSVIVEIDRFKAIQNAVKNSLPGDTILVAGKGHEDYQDINGVKYPFDDCQVIKELSHDITHV